MSNPSKPPLDYLNFLPATYSISRTGDEQVFISQYIKIFQKILSGLDDADDLTILPEGLDDNDPGREIIAKRKGIAELLDSKVIGSLFFSRLSFLFPGDASFMPALSGAKIKDKTKLLEAVGDYVGVSAETGGAEKWLNDFLSWLGTTVALNVDKNWSIDHKRSLIAQALVLYRARGTIKGTQWLLNAWLGLPLEPQTPPTPTSDQNGKLVPWQVTVREPGFPPIYVQDKPHPELHGGRGQVFRLFDRYHAGVAILSDIVCTVPPMTEPRAYVPWQFEVTIRFARDGTDIDGVVLPDGDDLNSISDTLSTVMDVLDEMKPALTQYVILTPQLYFGGGRPRPANINALTNQETRGRMEESSSNPTVRPVFSDRMILKADDLAAEQRYHMERTALLNRSLYTPGVIGDGLRVTVNEWDPAAINVTEGAAFDAHGRLLIFEGTPADAPLKVTPEQPEETFCYMYLVYRTSQDDFRAIDTVDFVFTNDKCGEGALLAKLTLDQEAGRVTAIATGGPHRQCATSRLPAAVAPSTAHEDDERQSPR